MQCHDCTCYDDEAKRCRIGKSNPQRKADAVALAETIGCESLCMRNRWREDLLLRRFVPIRRTTTISIISLLANKPVEVEWLDE